MKSNPKISIVVPIYGVEKYLHQCVDSILAQTLKDIEIILVDDGSKDSCPKICDEYAKRDNRIKVIHKKNGGYGHSCNVGLDNASGEYLAIVEPDDFITSRMYEDLYKIAKENNSDIVKSCFYNYFDLANEQYHTKSKWDVKDIPTTTFSIKECPLFLSYHPSIWSCIYKRDFINKHNIRFVEAPGAGWTDNPFQVQTMCLAERINYTDEAYYYWRRLNKDDAKDLKDWSLPFKRSDEIHTWLDKKNITDTDIILNLYRRELAYIGIVLRMDKISNINDCLLSIKKLLERMDVSIVLKLKNDEINLFRKLLKNPLSIRRCILIKRFRKWLISIRLKKTETKIAFMGLKWRTSKNNV